MSALTDLRERRAALKGKLADMDKAAAGAALDKATQASWDETRSQLDAADAEYERKVQLAEIDTRSVGRVIGGGAGGADNRWNELLAGYSISRAIMHADASVDAGREIEVSREEEKRTGRKARGIIVPHQVLMERRAGGQVVGTPELGGVLAPDRFRPDLMVNPLFAASVLPKLGVTTIEAGPGNQVLPKWLTSGTVEWIGENAEPTESEATWGTITQSPHTAACTMSYSRRTLLNATPSIDALLRSDITRQVAIAIDRAAINGAGGLEPLGLLRQPGLPTISLGAVGGPVTLPLLIDLAAAPDIADAGAAGPAWLTTGKAMASILKLQDGDGRYMMLGASGSLLGYPVVRSSTVPSNLTKTTGTALSAVIFAYWQNMIVTMWTGLDVLSDPYTRGSTGAVRIYAFQDLDVGVRHIESFAAFVDVATGP